MIMKPVEKFTVFAFPGEIGSSRMFNESMVVISEVLWIFPGITAIAAVGIYGIAIYSAVNRINRTIAKD